MRPTLSISTPAGPNDSGTPRSISGTASPEAATPTAHSEEHAHSRPATGACTAEATRLIPPRSLARSAPGRRSRRTAARCFSFSTSTDTAPDRRSRRMASKTLAIKLEVARRRALRSVELYWRGRRVERFSETSDATRISAETHRHLHREVRRAAKRAERLARRAGRRCGWRLVYREPPFTFATPKMNARLRAERTTRPSPPSRRFSKSRTQPASSSCAGRSSRT